MVTLTWIRQDKKSRSRAASGATSKAFCTRLRIIRGNWDPAIVDTVPSTVQPKHRQIKVILKPAPAGAGLSTTPTILKKMLTIAGIKDCLVTITGEHQKRHVNLIRTSVIALKKLNSQNFF